MSREYSLVLKRTYDCEGLKKEDTVTLLEYLNADEFYPIDLTTEHDTGLMGFIGRGAAALFDYDYMESGLIDYMTLAVDSMERDAESSAFKFRGVKIYII